MSLIDKEFKSLSSEKYISVNKLCLMWCFLNICDFLFFVFLIAVDSSMILKK